MRAATLSGISSCAQKSRSLTGCSGSKCAKVATRLRACQLPRTSASNVVCACMLSDHNWAFEFVRARHELGAAESVQAAAHCMSRLRAIQLEFETAAVHVAQCVVRELYLDGAYQSIPRSSDSVLPAHVLGGLVVLVANDSLACLGGDEAAAKMEVLAVVYACSYQQRVLHLPPLCVSRSTS